MVSAQDGDTELYRAAGIRYVDLRAGIIRQQNLKTQDQEAKIVIK